jgi:hypothetical protein
MNNLTAKCMDPGNPDTMVEHQVRCEIDGRPYVLAIYATDPMHAIQRAQETPHHLWRLDVKEVNHA